MIMHPRRVLLLYISEYSGHHSASLALEKALHSLDPKVETENINSFHYTNPILERIINKTYLGVVRRTPELWDYLYDNPKVVKSTQKLREMIHNFNTEKLKTLLDNFKPDCIICTQAFPCGMVADYKKTFSSNFRIVGVLTDYAPHSYWMYNNVEGYIVPADETGKKLIENGVDPARIFPFGIPIDEKFNSTFEGSAIFRKLSLEEDVPCALIMGGTQGLGPIKMMANLLDKSDMNIQMIIIAGTNKRLYDYLARRKKRFRKRVVLFSYAGNIEELMHISTVIVTKPGGITTAEALAKGLPMLIVNPLPGQEAMNTKYLRGGGGGGGGGGG